jgi:hypothetical protein
MRFNATIYRSGGIQAAVNAFADFGAFEWSQEASDGYFDVTITAADDIELSDLEGEFGNFAFARSFDERSD